MAGQEVTPDAIQFSGFVVTTDGDSIRPVPYATVGVAHTPRGTYANYAGFFSLVVRPGETVVFSAIGFKTAKFTIPDTIRHLTFHYIQYLETDTIMLPEATVYPWPSRRFLKQEFLALNVTNDLQVRIQENLMKETMDNLRIGLAYDPKETSRIVLRETGEKAYYMGQLPPHYMTILNPSAWYAFFKAIKNGVFKKDKK